MCNVSHISHKHTNTGVNIGCPGKSGRLLRQKEIGWLAVSIEVKKVRDQGSGKPLTLTLELKGCRWPLRESSAGPRALGAAVPGSYIEKACLSLRKGAEEGGAKLESPLPTPPAPPLTPVGQRAGLPPPRAPAGPA